MESSPALAAILSGISDSTERERIAKAFDSLSQGDEMSYPVIFALVANGTARSVAQSAALIRDCADRLDHCLNSAPDRRQKPVGQIRTGEAAKNRKPTAVLPGMIAGLVIAAAGACGSFAFFKSRFETKAADLASQYAQAAELMRSLRAGGGDLRFYAARDAEGKTVRTLAVDGGTNPPREAFLNAAGQAIVLLNPLPGDPP